MVGMKISAQDSGRLARLAKHWAMPQERKDRVLSEIEAEDAREVGRVIMGADTDKDDIREAANIILGWAEQHRVK
jgi:hypothetical protein